MKCQKCMQPAVVHLTELLSDGPVKKAVEIHLCYEHAIEAGLLSPGAAASAMGIVLPVPAPTKKKSKKMPEEMPTAIAPSPQTPPGGLTVVRKDPAATGDAATCPNCGNTWSQFKQSGMMGCPHDYAHFEGKILPLVKRAQEGATQHTGKVPAKAENPEVTREVTTTRLRRELQKAIDAERYEEAARLRDELKKFESN